MADQTIADLKSEIKQLKSELQHQKGMLWIIGKIIKNATNITSFQELMKIITDMLMGVMGLSSCYLVICNADQTYTFHFRSIFLHNKYTELNTHVIPGFIKNTKTSKPFLDLSIQTPLVDSIPLPGSRLTAPLFDALHQAPIGFLVVEHESTNFFKETTCSLFETLAIFIGSHSNNSKLFESITMEAEKDPLTNAFNRKYLNRILSEPFPSRDPLSLCIFDIDHFKSINDVHGHEKGDDVLVSIAKTALNIITPLGGKVIRYGGDEFVLLLDLPLKKAVPILNQVRTAVPALAVMKGLSSPVTITMGVAEYPNNTTNKDKLLAIADNALLRGKNLGKNILEVG